MKYLDEVRKREEAATEGPWAYEMCGEKDNTWRLGQVVKAGTEDELVSGLSDNPKDMPVEEVCGYDGNGSFSDASFIAHARQDIPRLLRIIKKLTGPALAILIELKRQQELPICESCDPGDEGAEVMGDHIRELTVAINYDGAEKV